MSPAATTRLARAALAAVLFLGMTATTPSALAAPIDAPMEGTADVLDPTHEDTPAPKTNPLPPEASNKASTPFAVPAALENPDLTKLLDPTPRTGPTYSATTSRHDGRNRFEVGVSISKKNFPNGAPVVYLARHDVLTDALVAGVLRNGPILLTQPTSLPAVVNAEITRLGNPRVVVIGGPGSVTNETARAAARGGSFVRLSGTDRIGASAAVARYAFPNGARHAYFANGFMPDGQGSPDAVSAGSITDGPILWVDPRYGLDPRVKALLTELGVSWYHQLGWTNLKAPVADRIGSHDRYGVSVAVAERVFGVKPPKVYLARGDVYSDAVSGGSVTNGPALLTQSNMLPHSVCAYLRRAVPSEVVALGGTGSVSSTVLAQARNCASRGTFPIFSNYSFHKVDNMPYVGKGSVPARRDCVNNLDPSRGIHTRKWDGVNVFHPVSLSGQTLQTLMRYAEQPNTAEGCYQLKLLATMRTTSSTTPTASRWATPTSTPTTSRSTSAATRTSTSLRCGTRAWPRDTCCRSSRACTPSMVTRSGSRQPSGRSTPSPCPARPVSPG